MFQIKYKDYDLDLPEGIYLPSDDTYLLIETLKKESFKFKNCFLEVGPGSGVITFEFYNLFNNLTVLDIDIKVINYLNKIKKKYVLEKLEIIQSDLFSKIKNKKFDVIVFNPPYVPSETIDVFSTDGGKEGSEIIFKFINDLKSFLNKEGVCYLLVTSHNNLKKIYQIILKNNLKYEIINQKNIFFEKLIILKISE